MRAVVLPGLVVCLLGACGNTDAPLRDLQANSNGPDEFAVIPFDPLQTPPSNDLPTPTPGGANRADPTPQADAIAALGGNATASRAGGVPASDRALVAGAARYGVPDDIRQTLAAEYEARLNRARRTNLFNPFGRDRYFPAFAGQALDAEREAARLAALGITVPQDTTDQ